ncbi:hypothetical protein N431DRAFT_530695 [Stipitochalara longipes BDJ]|nr:hypothetical protein N431DRAFT_530695 [Stipitochalara longipes BDJ]
MIHPQHSKSATNMKPNNISIIFSILLGLLSQAISQAGYHPPSPNFLLECTKGHSAQGCWSQYGTYCDKIGRVRNPKPNSRTECVGQTKGWCYCSRVADDIIENPYYKWPPSDTDLPGRFGPGGVGGTSGSPAPFGYMAWESFKLKNGSNSTNVTYSGPAPLLVLHDLGANTKSAPRYHLVALILGAALSGLVPPSWGMLLIIGSMLLPQVAAYYSPPSPNFLLECRKGAISLHPSYCKADSFSKDAALRVALKQGWCRCSRVVDDILENPYYKPNNNGGTDMGGSLGPGGVGGTSGSAAPFGYMAWESLKNKAPNGTNSTNATYSGAPLLVLHASAARTQTALQSGGCALILMIEARGKDLSKPFDFNTEKSSSQTNFVCDYLRSHWLLSQNF